MLTTCGIYLYNLSTDRILIGHVTNTEHAFSIPKGLFEEDKDGDYFTSAKRELFEETNLNLDDFKILHISEFDFVPYRTLKKQLKSFLVVIAECNIEPVCNSTFMNNKGVLQPEIDWFKYVTLDEAKEFLPLSQVQHLENIRTIINNIKLISNE